jgi:TetR/AcrR family transcriptional repressor of nem operon
MNEAKDRGDLPDDFQTMEFANFFWIVWEGVILRARVERSVEPLAQFRNYLFVSLLGDRAREVREPA